MMYRTAGEFLVSVRGIDTDEKLAKLNIAIQHGQFNNAATIAEAYRRIQTFTEEYISVPLDEFFEDMDAMDIGIEIGPFYEYDEHLYEAPMVKLRYLGKQTQVFIDDIHRDKPKADQEKITYYAISWKMKRARKDSGISENELNKPFSEYEFIEMKKILHDLRVRGIKLPRGEIRQKEPMQIQGFTNHSNQRLDEREIDVAAAQAWVDSSIIMLKRDNARRSYISFDGSIAVEIENETVRTIYPSTSFGEGSRRLMQKTLSLIKQRK